MILLVFHAIKKSIFPFSVFYIELQVSYRRFNNENIWVKNTVNAVLLTSVCITHP